MCAWIVVIITPPLSRGPQIFQLGGRGHRAGGTVGGLSGGGGRASGRAANCPEFAGTIPNFEPCPGCPGGGGGWYAAPWTTRDAPGCVPSLGLEK